MEKFVDLGNQLLIGFHISLKTRKKTVSGPSLSFYLFATH